MSEFLQRGEEESSAPEVEELDVQKAVVESLAADKAEQGERIRALANENNQLKSEKADLISQIAEMRAVLENVGDVLAKNTEATLSNKVALLEREPELSDRFPGETRDHVLEILKAARDEAERVGQLRRAQLLEGVLLANAPAGELEKRRDALKRLFQVNGNVINGTVIAELEKMGISHKNGESYLLVEEIIKRNY